jgi:hypothetical protein
VYLDTHAGRGKHVSGQTGSPVVAIDTFLSHAYRDRILEKSFDRPPNHPMQYNRLRVSFTCKPGLHFTRVNTATVSVT